MGTDLLGRYYVEAYDMTVMTTRMFTHPGPRRGDVFHGSTFAKQIAMIEAGLIEPKVMVGNLKSLRTYADVRDTVRVYYLLVTVNPVAGEYYNIGGTYTCEVGDTLGTVLILVPMKDRCFDHNRSYTTFEHLTEDFFNEIGENDLTHLDEIIEKHDYDMDVACGGRDKFIKRAKKTVENRCLHHHVFDEETLKKAFAFVELDVIDFSEVHDNWLIIGKRRGKYD